MVVVYNLPTFFTKDGQVYEICFTSFFLPAVLIYTVSDDVNKDQIFEMSNYHTKVKTEDNWKKLIL